MRINRDEPKFVEIPYGSRNRVTFDEYYKKDWVHCNVCKGLKRKIGERHQEHEDYEGKSCMKHDCTGIYEKNG